MKLCDYAECSKVQIQGIVHSSLDEGQQSYCLVVTAES